jgi:small subunit ribosomal protein S20
MANIKSAEKRILQNERQRLRNRAYRTRLRTATKQLRAAVAGGDAEQAKALLPKALQVIDQTAQKKVIHANAAARHKSRLTRAVDSLAS